MGRGGGWWYGGVFTVANHRPTHTGMDFSGVYFFPPSFQTIIHQHCAFKVSQNYSKQNTKLFTSVLGRWLAVVVGGRKRSVGGQDRVTMKSLFCFSFSNARNNSSRKAHSYSYVKTSREWETGLNPAWA